MKKLLIIIGFVLVMAGIAFAECNDNNKDFNIYKPGTVVYLNETFEDRCIVDMFFEHYCINDTMEVAFAFCPFNCSDNYTCAACVQEGFNWTNERNVKFGCCSGLVQIENSVYIDGQCVPAKNQTFTCTKCGDSICGEGENKCNCPSDCTGACPIAYDPVCGEDGRTYSNECLAGAVKVQIAYSGQCCEKCNGFLNICGKDNCLSLSSSCEYTPIFGSLHGKCTAKLT